MASLGAIDSQDGAPLIEHPTRSPAARQASRLKSLPSRFDDERYSDTSVEVNGGPPIHVNRLVLSLLSEPLEAMLYGKPSFA